MERIGPAIPGCRRGRGLRAHVFLPSSCISSDAVLHGWHVEAVIRSGPLSASLRLRASWPLSDRSLPLPVHHPHEAPCPPSFSSDIAPESSPPPLPPPDWPLHTPALHAPPWPPLGLVAPGGLAGSGSTCRQAALVWKAGPCPSCCRTTAHLSGGSLDGPGPGSPASSPSSGATSVGENWLGPLIWVLVASTGSLAARSPSPGTARRPALPAPRRGGRGSSTLAHAPKGPFRGPG